MDCHVKPLVSVIIPVYNASRYLAECVQSVLDQSYPHLEVLLVDDGSTDDSLSVCRQLSQEDNRVSVLSKQNGGASSARNWGLSQARGYWVVFVDSDDFVKRDYIQHLVEAACQSDVDFVISGLQYWDEITGSRVDKSYPSVTLKGKDLVLSFLQYRIYENGGPISKLYKASILKENGISFNEKLHYAEDCDFMLKYIRHIGSLRFIAEVDYIYRLLPTSLSHRQLAVENEEACLLELLQRYVELHKKFQSEPLDSFQVSLLQFFLRYSTAVSGANWSRAEKFGKLKALKADLHARYSHQQYFSYLPYCLEERIHHFLLWYAHPYMILLYKNCIFPSIRRILHLFQ